MILSMIFLYFNTDAMNRCRNEHRGACLHKFFGFSEKRSKNYFFCLRESQSASARHGRASATLMDCIRDVDGLHHIDRLLRSVAKHKLSMCLSVFPRFFRCLSDFVLRLSAKPTKLKVSKPNGVIFDYEVPDSCPADCHGECSSCALM